MIKTIDTIGINNMHDINKYYGDNKPDWNPNIDYDEKNFIDENKDIIKHYSDYPIYTMRNVFPQNICDQLITEFESQKQYAVGVNGHVDANEQAGSYRTMAWSESIANKITETLDMLIEEKWFIGGLDGLIHMPDLSIMYTPFIPEYGFDYDLLGSTPWLRFMRYGKGGKHTPHYDAPFHNKEEKYITLFSWVLYLNTPEGEGGSFQFVDDAQQEVHPLKQHLGDWDEMSESSILEIKPEVGKLLVFPHWLCHQVQEYTGEGYRYIIRGDVAYGESYDD